MSTSNSQPVSTDGRDRQIIELFAEVEQPPPTPAERRVFVDMSAAAFGAFAQRMRSMHAEAKAAARLDPNAVYSTRKKQQAASRRLS